MIYRFEDDQLPFHPLIAPIAARAFRRLRDEAPSTLLTATAWEDLASELTRWTAETLVARLFMRLHAIRAIAGTRAAWEVLANKAPEPDPSSRAAVDDWVAETAAMIRRLHEHPPATGAVANIAGPLSEFHRGAAVRRLSFTSGEVVVYKPRDCSMEAWWRRLTVWLSDRGLAELRAPQAWARGGFGWCEHICSGDVSTAVEVNDFYRRAGQLLCWLWLTHTRDAVRSNVVAAGAWPVLVDAETALYPLPPGRPWDVQQTGAVPHGRAAGASTALALEPVSMRNVRMWRGVSSDDPRLERVAIPFPDQALPRLHGQRVDARGLVGEVTRGFVEAYEAAARNAAALLDDDGPLAGTSELPGRVAFRPTALYGEMLHRRCTSDADPDELLARCALATPLSLDHRGLLIAAEARELARLSVPRFTRTGLDVAGLGGILADWTPGDGATRQLLTRLDTATLDDQVEKIADGLDQRGWMSNATNDSTSRGAT